MTSVNRLIHMKLTENSAIIIHFGLKRVRLDWKIANFENNGMF